MCVCECMYIGPGYMDGMCGGAYIGGCMWGVGLYGVWVWVCENMQ